MLLNGVSGFKSYKMRERVNLLKQCINTAKKLQISCTIKVATWFVCWNHNWPLQQYACLNGQFTQKGNSIIYSNRMSKLLFSYDETEWWPWPLLSQHPLSLYEKPRLRVIPCYWWWLLNHQRQSPHHSCLWNRSGQQRQWPAGSARVPVLAGGCDDPSKAQKAPSFTWFLFILTHHCVAEQRKQVEG